VSETAVKQRPNEPNQCYTQGAFAGFLPFRMAPEPEAANPKWRSTIAFDKRSAKNFIRINDRIRAREIRVIDENGEQMGILPPFEALKIARERGPRPGGSFAHRRTAGLPHPGLRPLPLREGKERTRRAQEAKGHRPQGSQVLRHRGRARLPDQEEPGGSLFWAKATR
jgi:hypothetical protein